MIRWRDETGRWSVARLALALYPPSFGAAAVNLFFASLMGQVLGGAVLSPIESALGGAILGVPATILFARWIRRLMNEADAEG